MPAQFAACIVFVREASRWQGSKSLTDGHLACITTQVSAQLAEPGADTDALMAKMDRLQTAIDACNGWELDRQVQRATDALRCPPGQPP